MLLFKADRATAPGSGRARFRYGTNYLMAAVCRKRFFALQQNRHIASYQLA
jgi:hypothetical protein